MLSRLTLPLRNVWYFRWSNLPILLGVALSAAVLTGSLVVGDSLRGSLRERALRRLNGVGSAYVGTKLLSESLARELPGQVSPAFILQGSVSADSPDADSRRLSKVAVVGVDPASDFFRLGFPETARTRPTATLSHRVAQALGVAAGSKIELGVERFSAVPRSSILGAKSLDKVSVKLALEVGRVLDEADPANDFDLSPNPAAPLNVYVPLNYLQARLEKPGRVNALLTADTSAKDLSAALQAKLTLSDWMLRMQAVTKSGAYLSLESEQLILDGATVEAAERTCRELGVPAERTLSYLANAIAQGPEPVLGRDVGAGRKMLPYSVVAALNPGAAAPLGRFLPANVATLADDEIVLADWPQSPLRGLPAGETVAVAYFKPEMEASEEETSARFRLRGYVPLEGVADDPGLTPPFPGITDKLKIGDWESPFEIVTRRIQPRDEDYWNRYKTTPKAYITTAAGERLFGSRFGTVTSLRVVPPAGQTPAQFEPTFRSALLKNLDGEGAGVRFQPTRERLLASSRGGNDFGVMFLLFSGLLIGSALLLVGLLFRLAVERRAKEVGLLLAAGYPATQVRTILTREGLLVASTGALLGIAVSAAYAGQMLRLLVNLWPDAEVGSYLQLHVSPLSPALGFVLTLLTAYLTIRLSLRGLTQVPLPALLRGTTDVSASSGEGKSRRWHWLVALLLLLAGLAALAVGPTRTNPDERAGAFFTGGLLLLAAGLWSTRTLLRRSPGDQVLHGGTMALVALGLRNAARNPARTLLSAALVAGSMFLVVSVESFRRKPDADFLKLTGGSGGLRLLAEADVPIFQPFDREPGRSDLLEALEISFQRQEALQPGGASRAQLQARAAETLQGLTVYPFRLRGGDDASCLNLSQAGEPRVLGVPNTIVARGGFRFTQTRASDPEDEANPWRLLDRPLAPLPDGRVPVAVLAEQNTVYFMLKTTLGGLVEIPDESGRKVPARIVGLLQDSVFQSDLLMSDAAFRALYPRQEGYRVFLLDTDPDKEAAVTQLLETGLRSNGLTVTPSRDRVATYQAVVGAYLSTFQLLGAFALVLAVLGLSVVILRNVWERAGELALLRAVGYRFRALQVVILSETLSVLALGLLIGVGSALASVLPNLTLGGSIPWARLAGLLAVTAATGAGVSIAATISVARMPIVPALRKD